MTAGAMRAGGSLRERVPFGPRGPIGLFLDPLTWRAAVYLLFSVVPGMFWFTALAVAVSVSLGLLIVWVGLPLFLLTILCWRGGAMLERRLMWPAFGISIRDPYRPWPDAGFVRRLTWLPSDPATWKDLGYLLLLFPLGLVEFTLSAVLWSCSIGFTAQPVLVLLGVPTSITPELVIDTVPESIPWMLLGLAFTAGTLYVVRGMGWLHGMLAVALLGPGDEEQVTHLRASRARGVDAAEAERRRIERDLHDGAQQRLLAVAMDLGRAQAKMESDPDEAKELLAQAHAGAKAAIAELRDLARGIYPAILTDRGLDAALSALAARAPVHVSVTVDIDHRPPPAVESIAYFVVAESLTNMAKHSLATEASVRVAKERDHVLVEIYDNGMGGAVASPGGGLAGLADRAATIDGTLTVHSPPGGPTVISARLPYEW
ncbi:sensor domain-containing protein [Sphaerisporangium sp. B11E5]|uniref:sensor histidine kinase n=1 Tax=Sphaerisporangium sp. B11E5 TaxID=3153563 RepID=UPI00325F137A